MRKKFVKSSRPTYKKRIRKGQTGMRFVSYNPVSNPTIDYTDITNPINPFSEYNFNTTYNKPEALVVPVKDETPVEEVINKPESPIVTPVVNKPVASKPVTANSTWKSPYTNRRQWTTELIDAYKKAGITNDNAIRMLLAQDALESSWGKSAQGKYNFGNLTTGAKWKGDYVTGNDKNAKGEAIKQKFRSYNSMDEYAADKIQFLKRLYDFDENDDINKFVAKLTGSNKGKRRYAEATNYAKVLTGIYNGIPKGENGMIIKYQEPAQPINRSAIRTDADKEVSKYNRAVYSSVNPIWGIPNSIIQAGRLATQARIKSWKDDQDNMEYSVGTQVGDSVADAAWRKRLGLSYDNKFLPSFNGDTVRLPKQLELEIPTDTNMLKKRIARTEELMQLSPKYGNSHIINVALRSDQRALNGLRETYKTGKTVGIDEYSNNSRQLVDNGVINEDYISPLNVFRNYNIRYDKPTNKMYYSKSYDFDTMEHNWDRFVPGSKFYIRGTVNLDGKK